MLTLNWYLLITVKSFPYVLEQAVKAQRGSNLGARRGWVFNATPRPLYPREKTQYSFYVRVKGPQDRPDGAGNLAPTGIRSQDCPARSKSLYRLSYPGPLYIVYPWCIKNTCIWFTIKLLAYSLT
jgi:hypothetical protein